MVPNRRLPPTPKKKNKQKNSGPFQNPAPLNFWARSSNFARFGRSGPVGYWGGAGGGGKMLGGFFFFFFFCGFPFFLGLFRPWRGHKTGVFWRKIPFSFGIFPRSPPPLPFALKSISGAGGGQTFTRRPGRKRKSPQGHWMLRGGGEPGFSGWGRFCLGACDGLCSLQKRRSSHFNHREREKEEIFFPGWMLVSKLCFSRRGQVPRISAVQEFRG